MLEINIESKKKNISSYKGYQIIRVWQERNGKEIKHSVKYEAYDSDGNGLCREEKLKVLKSYIDNMSR